MKYEFTINKTQEISDDVFELAMLAVKASIESILYDYEGVEVAYKQPNIIEISTSSEDISLPFDRDECLKLITPSILDKEEKLYSEFRSIKNTDR
ncbi:MAG: hypothetical protein RBR33_01155 [Sulfurovaceae bacterium]|jgi:hypothetical protein|nr:hypothetical protein [Sulfurovaceae bacterium]